MPSQKRLHVQQFGAEHDPGDFDCGIEALNEYIRHYASQHERKGYGRTYVLVAEDEASILGFYTLAAGAVRFEHLPESHRKKVPRHPMPVAHLARLAVDRRLQGQGFGSILLVDMLLRVGQLAERMGIAAVEVVAKNEDARRFYVKHGFSSLADDQLHLYMTTRTIAQLFTLRRGSSEAE